MNGWWRLGLVVTFILVIGVGLRIHNYKAGISRESAPAPAQVTTGGNQ